MVLVPRSWLCSGSDDNVRHTILLDSLVSMQPLVSRCIHWLGNNGHPPNRWTRSKKFPGFKNYWAHHCRKKAPIHGIAFNAGETVWRGGRELEQRSESNRIVDDEWWILLLLSEPGVCNRYYYYSVNYLLSLICLVFTSVAYSLVVFS